MDENNSVYTQEMADMKKKEISDVIRKYKDMKKMSNRMVDNYYTNMNMEGFTFGRSQLQRVLNTRNNYQIETLLKLLSILNLEIVIQPKRKEE